MRERAYGDHALPIGEEQTISQPYIVALMTSLLALTGREKVLEVGTGSGYQTAILAELARRVCSVERLPRLAERARAVLEGLGYSNVWVRVGGGTLAAGRAAVHRISSRPGQSSAAALEQLAADGAWSFRSAGYRKQTRRGGERGGRDKRKTHGECSSCDVENPVEV